MNETLKTLETRRSCHKFKPDMIKQEELDAILRAGTFAPSGGGKQSAIIVVVKDKKLRDELSALNGKIAGAPEGFDVFYGAPVVAIVLGKKDMPDHVYDGSLVMGNLLNAAASLGVGSIWVHRAKQEFEQRLGKEILEKLGITDEYEGIGHCCLGYEAEPPKEAAPRKENYVYYIE